MHRIAISLSIIALTLLLPISCAFYSPQAIKAYENQSTTEVFRGLDEMAKEHPAILRQIEAEQNQKNTPKENVVTTEKTPLKGSTGGANEKR